MAPGVGGSEPSPQPCSSRGWTGWGCFRKGGIEMDTENGKSPSAAFIKAPYPQCGWRGLCYFFSLFQRRQWSLCHIVGEADTKP